MARVSTARNFSWPAPAKLNLFLHITGRRADGYHRLQTLFQFLDFGDELFFTPRGDGVIRRLGGATEVAEADDLVVRAGRALQSASGVPLGADIRVIKRIPLGGGFGGGSSDAATTLMALNRLWNLGLPPDELAAIGLKLGADVPVFVRGQAAWAEGVGENLRPVQPPQPWYLILAPAVHVSTAEIFQAPELQRDCAPVTYEDFLAGHTGNVCEPVTCARHPAVQEAMTWLAAHGSPRMTGTGGGVYLAFETEAQAHRVGAKAPSHWRHFVARGLNSSPVAAIMRAA